MVHAFQGRTVDQIVAAMPTGNPDLTNQRAFYVAISRARERPSWSPTMPGSPPINWRERRASGLRRSMGRRWRQRTRRCSASVPAGSFSGWVAEAGATWRDDRLDYGLRDSVRRVYSRYPERPRDGERENPNLPPAVGRTLVEGGANQAHRPGQVPENLDSKETGRADVCALGGCASCTQTACDSLTVIATLERSLEKAS